MCVLKGTENNEKLAWKKRGENVNAFSRNIRQCELFRNPLDTRYELIHLLFQSSWPTCAVEKNRRGHSCSLFDRIVTTMAKATREALVTYDLH